MIENIGTPAIRRFLGPLGRRLRRQTGVTSEVITRLARNASLWVRGRADVRRWSSPGGLEEWWDERSREIAGLVPDGSRVIEFGAGRRQLQRFLPADCVYIASDLVDRGPDTVVFDLNQRPLPDLRSLRCDVAVFGGVLEYVRDVPGLAHWLGDSGMRLCVASFDPVPAKFGILGRIREWARRWYYGYMNGLTEAQLLRCFEAAGFVCVCRATWTQQVIFRFLKQT